MSKKPISPLRQRMIDDMTARRFKEKVQKDYVRHVRKFAAFLGRSPDTATSEDLRRYQLHMAQEQVSPWTINSAIAALRFFFTVTLERPRPRSSSEARDRAAPNAGGAEPGGGGASPRSCAGSEKAGQVAKNRRINSTRSPSNRRKSEVIQGFWSEARHPAASKRWGVATRVGTQGSRVRGRSTSTDAARTR